MLSSAITDHARRSFALQSRDHETYRLTPSGLPEIPQGTSERGQGQAEPPERLLRDQQPAPSASRADALHSLAHFAIPVALPRVGSLLRGLVFSLGRLLLRFLRGDPGLDQRCALRDGDRRNREK